jgi:hypothetical protein
VWLRLSHNPNVRAIWGEWARHRELHPDIVEAPEPQPKVQRVAEEAQSAAKQEAQRQNLTQ